VASLEELLALADRARTDATVASPHDLWKVAHEATAGDSSARQALYQHAMIHAGYVVSAETDALFAACPVCGSQLQQPEEDGA
jgi:hypothetical protein